MNRKEIREFAKNLINECNKEGIIGNIVISFQRGKEYISITENNSRYLKDNFKQK